jgi:hypothetical protein
MRGQLSLTSGVVIPWRQLVLLSGFAIVSILVYPVEPLAAAGPAETVEKRTIVVVTGDDDGGLDLVSDSGDLVGLDLPHFKASRGYLGVVLVDHGVMVSRVSDESPARLAGIQVGDIISAIDDDKIEASGQILRSIGVHSTGDTVTLDIWRNGNLLKVPATLTEIDRPQVDVGALVQSAQIVGAKRLHHDRTARSSEAPHDSYKFRWRSDGAGPHQIIEIRPENFDAAMKDLEKFIVSPAFKDQLRLIQKNRGDLTKRIAELEKRLQEMEEELQKMPTTAP